METTGALSPLGVLVLGLVLASTAGFAGCVDADRPPGEAKYRVSGTFTENATQDQMQQLGDEATQRGGDFAQLESFPVQFRASGLAQPDCEEVRAFAQEREYVADLGECERMEDAGGDEPTSNGS